MYVNNTMQLHLVQVAMAHWQSKTQACA